MVSSTYMDITDDILDLAQIVITQLTSKKFTLAVAESATGGYLSHILTSIAGSSKVFMGGVVAYSAYVKNTIFDVTFDTINEFGAISSETTESLLKGLKNRISTDLRIAITGVAGTHVMEGKPRGLVYIGIGTPACNKIEEIQFKGTRLEIKQQAVKRTLEFLLEEVENL
ncbi:MAG: CinA family protein [Promethearchaeota archaeon]